MSPFRLASFAASLVMLATVTAAEPTNEPRLALQPTHKEVIDRTNDSNWGKVCYHAGDTNGFETCTDMDQRDCRMLANDTLICENAP